ncbi:MAG: AtpZ/AtpI family protein [Proteobacteria bacterium]|nr:AtpZ/AtpI family protein [Pseudomonadota bacterium]
MENNLGEKIRRFEKKLEDENHPKPTGGGMASAGRAGYDLIVALVFFTLIGVLLDTQLDTLPWFTLGLFFLGFATGLYNAWRTLNAKGDRVGLTQPFVPKSSDKRPKNTL